MMVGFLKVLDFTGCIGPAVSKLNLFQVFYWFWWIWCERVDSLYFNLPGNKKEGPVWEGGEEDFIQQFNHLHWARVHSLSQLYHKTHNSSGAH